MLRAAVLLLGLAGSAVSASMCKDTAELVSYVRERVAGLEETAIEEVVAALQATPPSCITSDVLEERERCGEQGQSDAVRAVQMFALGLDAVPAPIRPSPGVPCVQIPSSPDIVVLEWSHDADSMRRVRSFDVRRELVGGGASQAEVRKLTTAEFEKCRDKGRCTFKDHIEPGQKYIYSVTATNSLGASSAAEIFCATRADASPAGLSSQCSPRDEDGTEVDGTKNGEGGAINARRMSVYGTVAWCVASAAIASVLTIFLLDRAVVNGNAQLCDTISRRMSSSCVENEGQSCPAASAVDQGRFETLLQKIYRWNSIIFLAFVYSIGIWMWLPVELQLLPTLNGMAEEAQRYIAREMTHQGETSYESFMAIQGSGQSVKLVGDSWENFKVSAYEWERGLLALHREQRIIINSMVDGTKEVWQPEFMALFLGWLVLFAYVLELLVWTKWLWEGTQLKEMLQYTSSISPGCKLGRYLYPLCCLGCWRAYALIDAAIRLANHMRRNVDQLKKLADFLPPSEDMARIRTGLHEIVRNHNEGKQRRWGITLGQCAGGPCHIDNTFWKVGTSTAKYVIVSLVFLVPLVLLVVRDMKNRKEQEEQEQLIDQQRRAHEAVKQLAEEKERQYIRAENKALTQQQRAEALENARKVEQKERDAIKEEQRLVMREIRLQDLTALWEDRYDAPPNLRKNDWRRCVVNEGAAGQICRAWCEGHLRKKVAIKRVSTNARTAMLQRSFSTLSGRLDLTDEQKFFLFLQHENIAKCYGTLQEKEGVHSIVMELCRCDLRQWLSDDQFWKGLTQQQIDEQKLDAIGQVSQGLQFLHDKHVVHLDLKAGNLLLEMLDDGRPGSTWKLCDFGEAVRLHKGEDQEIDTHLHDAHDRRNLTPEIASPELFSGTGVSMKADIFAFGCVMWSILTRLEAWHWIKGAYKGHTIENAVGLDAKRPRCPDSQITDKIRQCMHHNARMRPSAQELSVWANKRLPRRSRTTRSRVALSEAVVRVVEVPSDALLGEAAGQLWTGSVPGLLGCEHIAIPPVHGCKFQVECSENTEDLTIRTTQHGAEEWVTEEAVHALFNDCDVDNNGGLDKAEIRQMLARGGIEWSSQLEQELEGEWGSLAIDGEVDFRSFFRWWTTVSPSDERSHLRRELHRAGMFSTKRATVRFPCTVTAGCIVTDSSRGTGLSWNITGQYIAKQDSTSREQWEEDALQGNNLPRSISQEKEKDDEAQGAQVTIRAAFSPTQKNYPNPGIGIKFGNEWPYVKSIQPGTPAQDIPGLQAGCKLLRIESALSAENGVAVMEGEAVLMGFNDALPHITAQRTVERPLVLTFAAAAGAET
eukprot:COSAG02_NODE_389_length_23251_cov_259.067640_10_plen_1328_part_00